MRRNSILLIFFVLALIVTALPASAAEPEMQYIVQLDTPLPALMTAETEDAPVQELSAGRNLYVVKDAELVDLLRQEGMLVYAEPDYPVELLTEGEVEEIPLPDQWHLDYLDFSEAEALHCCGQEVRIAVIDSGVQPHSALKDAILPGYNYLDNNTDVTDNIGHGTFVAGLIAAQEDGQGLMGAAPMAKIIPLKCFDDGKKTYVSTLCSAIYDAVDRFDFEILNMSLGVTGYSKTLEAAIRTVTDAGTLVVAASGNSGNSTLYYPAAFSGVIGVGAVDRSGTISSFSTRNESVLVTAPGREICSTDKNGSWSVNKGTSFSTPLVCAVLARLLNVQPLTPEQAIDLLSRTATDLGPEGYDTSYGYGLVNMGAALRQLLPDAKAFLTTVTVQETGAVTTLINREQEPLSAMCVFATYEDGKFTGLSSQPLHLQPREETVLSFPEEDGAIKCFLLSTIETPTPLAPSRTYEK